MKTCRLPIEDLKLIAWYELMENDSIIRYQAETTQYFKYWDRFGNPLPYKGIAKAFDRLGDCFSEIAKHFKEYERVIIWV